MVPRNWAARNIIRWPTNGSSAARRKPAKSGARRPTKINERFFLGGDTLRGFEYAGIGPRDLTNYNNDALGGNRFTRGSVDLATPTPFPPELGLQGHFFVDAGDALGGKTDENSTDGDIRSPMTKAYHLSSGVGVTWASPFGPVRLDFAEPILYQTYDKIEHIHFSFGTKF